MKASRSPAARFDVPIIWQPQTPGRPEARAYPSAMYAGGALVVRHDPLDARWSSRARPASTRRSPARGRSASPRSRPACAQGTAPPTSSRVSLHCRRPVAGRRHHKPDGGSLNCRPIAATATRARRYAASLSSSALRPVNVSHVRPALRSRLVAPSSGHTPG